MLYGIHREGRSGHSGKPLVHMIAPSRPRNRRTVTLAVQEYHQDQVVVALPHLRSNGRVHGDLGLVRRSTTRSWLNQRRPEVVRRMASVMSIARAVACHLVLCLGLDD